MKYYFFTVLLLSTGFLCLSQTNSVDTTTSFNGFHCDGKQGICDIGNQRNTSQNNTTWVLNSNGTLTLTIKKNKISEQEIIQITGTTTSKTKTNNQYNFIVPKTYILPANLKESLTSNTPSLQIKSGTYPIQFSENHLTIIFNLK